MKQFISKISQKMTKSYKPNTTRTSYKGNGIPANVRLDTEDVETRVVLEQNQ